MDRVRRNSILWRVTKPNTFCSTFSTLVMLSLPLLSLYSSPISLWQYFTSAFTRTNYSYFHHLSPLVSSGFLCLNPLPFTGSSNSYITGKSTGGTTKPDRMENLPGLKLGNFLHPISSLSRQDSGELSHHQLPEQKLLSPSSVFFHPFVNAVIIFI